MIIDKKKLIKNIAGLIILFSGLMISTFLISKGMVLYSDARFETGKSVTSCLIFILSSLVYFNILKGLKTTSVVMGFLFGIGCYLLADIAVVNYVIDFFIQFEMKDPDIGYFIIHFCSILLLLIIELLWIMIYRRIMRKAMQE